MNAPLKGVSKVTEQSIEELQKRYQRLNTRKIEAGINLSNATAKLSALAICSFVRPSNFAATTAAAMTP